MILAVPLAELRALGAIPLAAADWLAHPLVAPVVIAATWVPVETLLVALTRSTPGKWLFGIYLQFDDQRRVCRARAGNRTFATRGGAPCASGGRAWAAASRWSRRS